MAKTGSITITQGTQDIANNKTPITVKGIVTTDSQSYRGDHRTGTYKITQDGTTIENGSFTCGAPYSTTTTLFTASVTVTHKSDGTSGTITASYNYDNGWCTASKSTTLTKINRQSAFGTISGTTIGSDMTVNITRYNSSYTHNIYYRVGTSGNWSAAVASGVGTSATFTLPMSICSSITSAKTGTIQLLLRTLNGSTQIGSDVYKNVTVTVPNNSSTQPTATIEISDQNGYAKDKNTYLKGMSSIKVSTTASGKYSATIKSVSTKIDSSTYSSNPAVSPIINKTGTINISVTVTDSRGYTTTVTDSVTAIAYNPPKISSLKATRCNEDGTVNNSGGYIKVTFSATIDNISGNTAKYVLQYKKLSASAFTTHVDTTKYDGSFTVTNGYWIFAADTGTYTINLTASDKFSSTPKTLGGLSALKLFSIVPKGLGIAFGKIAELSDYFDVGFNARFRKHVEIDGTLRASGGSCIKNIYGVSGEPGYLKIATININKEYQSCPLKIKISQRGKAGIVDLHIQFYNDQGLDPKVNNFYYSSITECEAYLYKSATSTWDLYIKKSEPYDHVGIHSYDLNTNYMSITTTWKDEQFAELPTVENQEELVKAKPRISYDSGWKTVTLNSAFKVYGSQPETVYRKIGNVVNIQGVIQPTSAIEGSTTMYTIFTLPEGYRPSKHTLQQVCQGSTTNRWLLTVDVNGTVSFSRYNNGSAYVDASTSIWLPFHISFFTD